MCKALEDLVRDSIAEGYAEGYTEGMEKGIEKAIFSLRKDGHISAEMAAEKLGLCTKEYLEKENEYFKAIG